MLFLMVDGVKVEQKNQIKTQKIDKK